MGNGVHFCHPELVSGSMPRFVRVAGPVQLVFGAEAWMLKRVQHDIDVKLARY
jgi:hypothetical protein